MCCVTHGHVSSPLSAACDPDRFIRSALLFGRSNATNSTSGEREREIERENVKES